MCDFRTIYSIELNGEIISTISCKEIDPANMDKVTEPGLYLICCTGSHHLYFDGNKWIGEYRDDKWFKRLDGFKVLEYKQLRCGCYTGKVIHDGSYGEYNKK